MNNLINILCIIIIGFNVHHHNHHHVTFAISSSSSSFSSSNFNNRWEIMNSSIIASSSPKNLKFKIHPKYQPIIKIEKFNMKNDGFIVNNNYNNNKNIFNDDKHYVSPSLINNPEFSTENHHSSLLNDANTLASNGNNRDNENLVVMTTPTYRKLKFKRLKHQHKRNSQINMNMNERTTTSTISRPYYHGMYSSPQINNHKDPIINENIVFNDKEDVFILNNDDYDDHKEKNKMNVTMIQTKYEKQPTSLNSESSPEILKQSFLNFYGPSVTKINRMKFPLTLNSNINKNSNKRVMTKRIKYKQVKTKSNPNMNNDNSNGKHDSKHNFDDNINDSMTDKVFIIPNEKHQYQAQNEHERSSTTRLPSLSATPARLSVSVQPLFDENDDSDILRNDLLTNPANRPSIRRSLPNFLPTNISSEFQSPNFRIQSTGFGRPAPKPSYHWSYNAPINVTSRFQANQFAKFSIGSLSQSESLKLNNNLHKNQPKHLTTHEPRNFFTAQTPKTPVAQNFHATNNDRNQLNFAYTAKPEMLTSRRASINNNAKQYISTPLMAAPIPTTTTTTTSAPVSITSFSRTAINNDNHRHPVENNDFDPFDDHFYHNYGVTSPNAISIASTTTQSTTQAPPKPKPSNRVRSSSFRNAKKSKNDKVTEKKVNKNDADRCTEQQCHLPYCRCGSSSVPAGLKAKDIPQLVMITFDDSINELNWDLYQEIFSPRHNPNGCPILGTFYVSHEWTDYSQVQNLYAKGHEMASHTITHSFGDKFSKEKWWNEVNGQREILYLYGGVKYEDVRGMRAPFLQPGGNRQYEMLHDANFTYDSSLPVFENNPPYWPYTFDYSMNHECMITPCPSKSFPGLWEVGMVMLIDHRGGRCSMVDACSHPATDDGVYENLLKNFNRHYHSNKAPFGLYFHSAWFNTAHHKNGFLKFIDHIGKNDDVYFVTKWQLIQWMMQPTPLTKLSTFQPFQCDYSDRSACHRPKVCSTSHRDGPRYLKTCQKCPKHYPWVGKTGFKSIQN